MNTRLLFAACLLLASSTCAWSQELFESRPPSVRPPDPEEGLVVVSLSTNSLKLDGVDTLIVDGVPSSYRLRSMASAYARDYALFVGALPEGRYSIRAIEERDAFRTLTLGMPSREMIGAFEVKRGQRCDLGRLVVTQFTLDLVMGRSAAVTDNEAALLRFAPDSARLMPPATQCWAKPRDRMDIVEAYARIFPADGTVAVELADGRVAVPSGMGAVMIRGTDGRWSVAHGEGMEQLLYLDDAPEHSLVAVGELNTIVRLGADGKLHRLDSGDLPLGNILFIDGNSRDGWHIVHQRAADLRIYRSPSLDSPVWTEIASTATGFSFWSGAKNFWVWPTANGFAYATTDQGLMRFYDYATRTWTERHTPKNNAIIAIAHSPNGVIGVVTSPGGGFGGITASQYYSRDGGQTWEEPPASPYKVKVSAPRLLADGTLLINGGVFGDAGLQGSKDGGKTWAMLWDKMEVDDFYWNLPRAGLLNFDKGRDGIEVISHSGDGGKTWRTEYLSVDRGMLAEHFKALDEAEKARKEAKKAAQANKKKK
jgi:hypothetical protein